MRFVTTFVLLILTVTTVCAPAHAAITFTGFYCPPLMPCDQSDPAFPAIQTIISSVNGCVASMMRAKPTESLFEDVAGLDSSGCLTNNQSALTEAGLTKSTPHCCIEAKAQSGCVMHCNIIDQ